MWWCRLRFRAERSIPLGFDQRLQAYLCGKGGAIIGDLPPYEAFPIGGTASVRGYGEGSVGSGRNYVAGTAELHFPLVAPFEVMVHMHSGCQTVHAGCAQLVAIGSTVAQSEWQMHWQLAVGEMRNFTRSYVHRHQEPVT